MTISFFVSLHDEEGRLLHCWPHSRTPNAGRGQSCHWLTSKQLEFTQQRKIMCQKNVCLANMIHTLKTVEFFAQLLGIIWLGIVAKKWPTISDKNLIIKHEHFTQIETKRKVVLVSLFEKFSWVMLTLLAHSRYSRACFRPCVRLDVLENVRDEF